jgi:hypothetical protein
MRSIVVALLTETETRLTSTAAALDNSRPAQLTGAAVRQGSAVARVLPEEQAIDPVAEELEISEPAIVPAADPELDAVSAMQELAIVQVAEPDSAREERGIVPPAVRMWALALVPARALVSEAVATALVIAVSHRARALVRAATLSVAPDLAVALRDQPAVGEVIAWAAVASAVEDAAVEAAEEAEAADAEDKQTTEG